MNTTFARKMVVSAFLCGVFFSASATEYTFPSAGGDLSSAAAWGGTRPGTSDKAIVDKSGDYTLSSDVTFNNFSVTTGGCNFAFTGRHLTLLQSGDSAFSSYPKGNGRVLFNGGVLDFSGVGSCMANINASGGTMVFTNGCVVTNVMTFHAAKGKEMSDARTEIAGAAKVCADRLNLYDGSDVSSGAGHDNILEIYDGGQLCITNRIYSDLNCVIGNHGGHVLRVRGDGSLFRYTGGNDVSWGFRQCDNILHVIDGARLEFVGKGALRIGSWNSGDTITNNALVVERSATASFPKIMMNTYHNRIFVGDDATLTTPVLQLTSSFNEVVISNATFTYSGAKNSTDGFNLATSADSTGNVFRVIGPDAVLSSLPWPINWFNKCGKYNTFSLEGGAKWGVDDHFDGLFANESHCTFRATGTGTVFGDAANKANRFYLCNKNAAVTAACASNVVEVSDGATLYAASLYLAGVDNALVVSNGTVDVKYLVPGFWYNDVPSLATNGMVRFCGTSPKVYVRGGSYCKIEHNSILRFEIPKAGYADNHVPLDLSCPLTFDSTSRLEIDCEELARDTYGTLTLIRSTSDISSEVRDRLLANVSGLPPRSSLVIAGKTVKLRCPRAGLVISFR